MFQSHNGEKQITQNIRTSQLQVIYLFVAIKVLVKIKTMRREDPPATNANDSKQMDNDLVVVRARDASAARFIRSRNRFLVICIDTARLKSCLIC